MRPAEPTKWDLNEQITATLREKLGTGEVPIERLRQLVEQLGGKMTLDGRDSGDALSPGQTAALPADVENIDFEELVEIALSLRPVVVCGEEFVVGIGHRDREPTGAYDLRIELREIRFGCGAHLRPRTVFATPTGFASGLTGQQLSFPARLNKPGKWPVEVDVEFQFRRPGSRQDRFADSSVVYTGQRTIVGEIEVLAEEPPDLFKQTHSPELDQAIVDCLALSEFEWVRNGAGSEAESTTCLDGTLWFTSPLPIGVALEAYAEFGDRRIEASNGITVSSGGSADSKRSTSLRFEFDGRPPRRITVILRSSKAKALRTTDLYEIWDGELLFEDVEVLPRDDPGWSPRDPRYTPGVMPRSPSGPSEEEP